MFRKSIAAAVALFLCVGSLFAGEHQGRVKSVDTTKGTITITVGRRPDTKEMTFTIPKDAKFTTRNKDLAEKLTTEGLKNEVFTKTGRQAARVTIITEGEGEKETVKEIKVSTGRRRPQQ